MLALLALAALAAGPSAALGAPATQEQQSPFQQAPAQSQNQVEEQTTPTPVPVTQTEADNGSLSTRDGLLIAAGIAALIGGIWFVIARDAKRATGGHVRTADSALGGGSATRTSRRSRRLSAAERKRRKRGRAAR
jgi:uncharacterized protein YcfJ